MAGRGPSPKDPSKRARRNADPVPLRVIESEPVAQPPLPDGPAQVERTREWWAMWGESPLSSEFVAADWDYLADTALIHAAFWSGDLKQAVELRLRVAKFGQTPEDRARLRIQFAQAEDADARVPRRVSGGRQREGLRLAE